MKRISLRKLALTLAMITLISVTLFPPVKADVQVTQEFVEPIKNWSFEEIGSSLAECPPWTASGGWREHRCDANDDGEINVGDSLKVTVARTLGKTAEEEPTCDVNIDGVITSLDSLDVTIARNNQEVPQRIDGKHSWYTGGGGDYVMGQHLDSDTINVLEGKQVTFSFWFLPESVAPDGLQNYAQAQILYLPEGSAIWNGAVGDWVYPTETKWHNAVVNVSIPSSVTHLMVRILGKPDFKAWIDQTSLSIIETKSTTGQIGGDVNLKMSLAVNLFELKDYDMPVYPCRAFLGVAMAADLDRLEDWFCIYYIDYTELRMKLITEDSSVTIRNVTQSNNLDYVTDPDQTEEIENKWIISGKIAIGLIATGVSFFLPEIPPYHIGNLILSVITGTGLSLYMSTWRADADTPTADDRGEYAIARIRYPWGLAMWANERGILELAFERGSSCQIEVTGKVQYKRMEKSTGAITTHTLEETISVTVSL